MLTTSFTRILICLFTFVCFISFDVAHESASNIDPDTGVYYSDGNFKDNKLFSKIQDNWASNRIDLTTNKEMTDKNQGVFYVMRKVDQELPVSKTIDKSSTSVKKPNAISAAYSTLTSASATSTPPATTNATYIPPVNISATYILHSFTSATSTPLTTTSATSTSLSSTSVTFKPPATTSNTSTAPFSTIYRSTPPASTSTTLISSTSATSIPPTTSIATTESPNITGATIIIELSSTSATTELSSASTISKLSSNAITELSPTNATTELSSTSTIAELSASASTELSSASTIAELSSTSATTELSSTSAITPLSIITTTVQLITTNESTTSRTTEVFTTEVFTRAIQAAETANNTSAIVGGVVGCILGLAAIAASIIFIFYFKRRSSQPRSRQSSPLVELDKKIQDYILEHRPIKILEFKEKVKRFHKDSNLLFQDDFEDIKKLSSKLLYTSNDAKKEGNKSKNRYSNILPYDHSRVKLLVQMEDDETMDYINANYIPGYNSVREYIATQGPLKSTLSDFWRMLWEQNSHVIVMLSDLYENQKPKVELYWPENLGEPARYENITVELTNFSQFNSIIIRTFRISKGSEVRKVVHFFIVWSDFDADLEVRDFLDLVQVVRMEASTKKSGPIVVHCSAGVGRTGTFIALDYFMQYIEKHSLQDSIDVFNYVMKMRNNRVSMVQAEVQYIFIHDVLVEVIDKKIKFQEGQMNQHIYYNEDDHAREDETVYVNMNELTNMKTGQENKAYEHDYDKDAESINV